MAESAGSRRFQRATFELLTPQNRRERLKDVVHDVHDVLHVHGLGAAGADQLPRGLGVQADAGGWDSPRGGSKAAKHKKTRHPKLYGSLRKVQLSAGSNPVRTPTTQRRLGNGHSRMSGQVVWRARRRRASEGAHAFPFVCDPWKGLLALGRKNAAPKPSRVEGESLVRKGLIEAKPAAGFQGAVDPFKSVANGRGVAWPSPRGQGASNEPRSSS